MTKTMTYEKKNKPFFSNSGKTAIRSFSPSFGGENALQCMGVFMVLKGREQERTFWLLLSSRIA